jgi:quercetin dioxygenase-like cupin family protein
MELHQAGFRPTVAGPASDFSGAVHLDRLVAASAPARVQMVRVTFAPGARTAWHTHPLGQAIHVLSGVGRAQSRGGPVREIRPGDTVWFAPDEVHWHGAAPDTLMVHIAVQEADAQGVATVWLDQVSDADYAVAPAGN